MNKRFLSVVLLCLSCWVLNSQNTPQPLNTENVEYYIQNHKVGLRDKSTHKIIVGCKYDYIGGYNQTERSTFKRNNLFGYLDNRGVEIIKPQYQKANSFTTDGYASIMKNDKWGVINKSGEIIISCKYDDIGSIKYGAIVASQNGKWFIINLKGEQISKEYDEKFSISDDGFSSVKTNGQSGVIDKNGKVVIPCKYTNCYLTEGLVMVQENEKWGYLDFDGRVIIPIACSSANHFYDGVALIERDNINMIIGSDTRTLARFEKGWLTDVLKGNREDTAVNPVFIYHLDGKEGLVDKNGRQIVSIDKDNDFGYFYGCGLIGAKRNDRIGFFDIFTGAIKIPFEYEESYYYFCKGYIPAKKNGKWGVIDTNGNTAVAFVYNMINATSSKFVKVQKETGWGIVDCSTGKEVVPCKYDEVGYPNATLMYCSVKIKGNEGYADFYGNNTLQ